jgi:succinate dehydrogenase/fumarate reductase flavoprotein subunit
MASIGRLHHEASAVPADVLVVGGGPAGAWAAIAAAEAGASVVLADKGYFGTSGATAPSDTGTWCVPPGEGRTQAVERRWQRTGGLGDQRWMTRCVDRAYENLLKLVEWGYPFPTDDGGELYVANLRGPDYMRFMRRRAQLAGVTILDHHPVLELLSDGEAITGAAGLVRATGEDWRVRAGAVVLATGGCVSFERILGGTGLSGDGYLMAAEAGASLSGMEFTGKYTLAPAGSSLNKGLPFRWGSFYDEAGQPLIGADGAPLVNGIGPAEKDIAKAMLGARVFCRLDLAEPAMQDWLRRGQPNCFLPYERAGIDPFRDLFEVTLKAEGTVRGTGGIHLVTADCGTGVAGLYAAGDAASRETMTGAVSGGGAVNASWAIASGWWAGHGAAQHARRRGPSAAFRLYSKPLGEVGLRPAAGRKPVDCAAAVATVQAEVLPLAKNYFRSGPALSASLMRIDGARAELRDHLGADGRDRLKAREVAAVTATARWSTAAAIARDESRGMHRRTDRPAADPSLARRLVVDGIDDIRVRPERELAGLEERAS